MNVCMCVRVSVDIWANVRESGGNFLALVASIRWKDISRSTDLLTSTLLKKIIMCPVRRHTARCKKRNVYR